MIRTIEAKLSRLALAIATAVLPGCAGPHAFVSQGDANSVTVGFTGDVANALPLARQHCAQFERVPRLADKDLDVAYFDCVRR